MARRLHSPALDHKLERLLGANKYDVIQIEGIEMANAWLTAASVRQSNHPSPISLFDDHNAEWTLQKTAYETDRQKPNRMHGALYSWVQYNKLKRFERAVCLAADAVVAVSNQDAQAIASLDMRIQPIVIPNGVDCEYYVPSEGVCAKPLAELALVFTGKMDFRPNIDAAVWFADEILPLVQKDIPLAHVSFVGQKPSSAVSALAARTGVEVTGFVPDTRPFIADAAVYVVPLRMGSGTRLKVLEAMGMGKAIVSTSFGVAGIDCGDGREVLVRDNAADFAHAVVSLLRNPERARELGRHARTLAQEKYDWNILIPRFEETYTRLAFSKTG
jgi:glycosyltransferase involved in cell wall biosynthesis